MADPAQTPRQDLESELHLGRAALAVGLVTPQALSKALLELMKERAAPPGKRRGLADLLHAGGLTEAQVGSLLESVPPAPAPFAEERDPWLGKVVLGVKLESTVERHPFVRVYSGRQAGDPAALAVLLVDTTAIRHGLWMDFLETVRAAKGLKTPNVLPVNEVGRVEGAFAVVTPHLAGGITLRALLRRVGRLKLSEALRIGREAAQGLADLHGANVAHRVATPESVFLGRHAEVVIRYPGVVFEPEGAADLFGKGTVYGLPHYLAPEALSGSPGSPQIDVYALGATLYELVTGVRPFEGFGIKDLAPQHKDVAPLAPHTVLADVPEPLSELLLWMLAKGSADRPTTAQVVKVLKTIDRQIPRASLGG